MFGVSLPELIVVCLIVLLVFGPDKLPEFMTTVGRVVGQFRRQSDSLRREFYNTVYRPAEEWQRTIDKESRNLIGSPTTPAVPPAAPPAEPAVNLENTPAPVENEKKGDGHD